MLASAEGDQVGAGGHKSFQIPSWWKFGGRIHDDRKLMLMRYRCKLIQRQATAFSASLIKQGRGSRPNGVLDLIGKSVVVETHLHKARTSRPQRVVVVVPMRAVQDDLILHSAG